MPETTTTTIQTTDNRQFALAVVGETYYAIDIEAVIEILPFAMPTPIPDSPVNVLGILDIRGGSVPIADLGACLGRKAPVRKESRIIILALAESRIGFVVDAVAEVVTIPNTSFQSNFETLSASRYVTEIAQLEDRLILSLDHQAVVDHGLDVAPAFFVAEDSEEAADDEDSSETEQEPGGLNVELLEASFALVAPKAEELAAYFYDTLFKKAPAVRELFPDDMAGQRKALIGGIGAIVKSLRNGPALGEFLTGLGERHVEYGAVAAHYPVVGEVLLETLAYIAGDAWNDELHEAWAAAYGAIQDTMIAAAAATEDAA